MNDITIVTAFFDIGRGNLPKEKHGRILPHYQHRTIDKYFEYFEYLAQIENELIVYTSKELAEKIFNIRKKYNLERKTKVVVIDNYLPKELEECKEKISKIMNSPEYYENIINPHLIEYWHVDYVLVNMMKSVFVTNAIQNKLVSNELIAWIDFGYCRNSSTLSVTKKWKFDFDKNKIHFFNIRDIEYERPIIDIIRTGDVYITGCHIVAGIDKWIELRNLVIQNLYLLIQNNLSDDDQTLLLMSYLTKKEDFQLHKIDESDWFIIFKEFNDAEYHIQTL